MNLAPSLGLLHVDPLRMGGSFTSLGHAFGITVSPPAAQTPSQEPTIAPPPRRLLAQGPMAPPQLSQAQVDQLQADLGSVVDALELELETMKAEAEMVAAPILRTEPELYKTIPVIGPFFTPQEVRSAIISASGDIKSTASRILTGGSSVYLTEDQKAKLQTISGDADALIQYVEQFDLMPLSGAQSRLARDYSESHFKAAEEMAKLVEAQMVVDEAAAVPVLEPMEKSGGPWGAILALGALVAVGIIIAEVV